jgi:hypothetical protein
MDFAWRIKRLIVVCGFSLILVSSGSLCSEQKNYADLVKQLHTLSAKNGVLSTLSNLACSDSIGSLLSYACEHHYDLSLIERSLREHHAISLAQIIVAHAPADRRRMLLRLLDQQRALHLQAEGIIPPGLDPDFREALARVLRVNREGLASWEDEVVNYSSSFDNSGELQLDEAAYHEGFKKIISEAKKFFFVINFDFNAHDIAGYEERALFAQKMREGLEGVLIFDEVGGRHTLTFGAQKQWMEDLRSLGMQVINNFSLKGVEHRKILVADDGHGGIVVQEGSSCLSWQYVTSATAEERFQRERAEGSAITPISPVYYAAFHDLMMVWHRQMAQKMAITVLLSLRAQQLPLHPDWADEKFLAWYLGDSWQEIAVTDDDRQGSEISTYRSIPWRDRGLMDSLHQVLDEAIASPDTRSVDFEVAYFLIPSVKERIVTLAKDFRPGGQRTRVNLIIPGEYSKGFCDIEAAYENTRSWYPELMAAGVNIYEVQGYTHVKVLAVNGHETIWISSGNPEIFSCFCGHDNTKILRHNDNSPLALAIERMLTYDRDLKSVRLSEDYLGGWEVSWRQGRQLAYRLGLGLALGLGALGRSCQLKK